MWNERDGALIFFSCGSKNRLEGFGASSLAALGVGWEEQLIEFCFPGIGAYRFLFYYLWLILVTVECLF